MDSLFTFASLQSRLMIMDTSLGLWVFTALLGGSFALFGLLKRANEWLYVSTLGDKKHSLPPGDMGWPLIGTMWSFFKAFKYGDPDSFISSFVTRYGNTGIYKALMFGSPSIIVTTPEACKLVLMDEERFGPGWPVSVTKLMGKKGLHNVTIEEHKRLLRLTAAPVRGHETLSGYLDSIKDIVIASLEELSLKEEPIEFLTEMRKVAFKLIMSVLLSGESDPRLEDMEKEYTDLNEGVISTPINLPGFAYHKALKARKKLVEIFQAVFDERIAMRKNNKSNEKRDMLHLLIEAEDVDGGKLSAEEIIDLLIIYLNAGHESSSLTAMWAVMFLEQHPQYFQKAKEEQEEIVRRRPSTEIGLSFKEIREMQYISKVIDETLRVVSPAFVFFREATCDININGYTIPKGWKVLAWIRNVHLDNEYYPNPKEFNPSRWDNHKVKAGTYSPFGGGSRLCPGKDLAKLEVSVFLHYYLLNYKFERVNPGCGMVNLPIKRPTDNCLGRIKKVAP
uniref:Uncharacterized protein n=1 Tax=Davidia involucrata TaxID=16924 RepID=A0A5B6YW95_DAVIN